MRRRLLASTLLIVLVCVVVLGVPLAVLARHQVWTSARDRVREQAAGVATGIEDQLDAGRAIDLHRFAALMPDRRIVVQQADGRTTAAGPTISGGLVRETVAGGDDTVTVETSQSSTVQKARTVTLLVVGLALLAVLAAIVLALWLSRRMTRPIADLADRADALGRADFAGTPLDSGVPEIDRVSHVLERSARQIGTLVGLQRDFASDAAHQLRTPLTSIGLHLEEIGRVAEPDIADEAEVALAQVERLDSVISSLLARARGDSAAPTDVDLGNLASHSAATWERVLAAADRELVVDVEPRVIVSAREAHLLAVLGSLLDNAVAHGSGTVSVRLTRRGRTAQLVVGDQGPGVPVELLTTVFERRVSGNHGTGIGLSLARSLTAAEGGELTVSPDHPAEFVMTLPLVST